MMTADSSLDLTQIRIDRLGGREALGNFNCGERDIDIWARKKASKVVKQNRMRIFVAKMLDGVTPLGFYTLSVVNEDCKKIIIQDRDVWAAGAPFIYIGYLAVQKGSQNCKLGTYLLVDCLRRAHWISHHIAFYGVALRSLNDRTTTLYRKFGFATAPGEGQQTPLMILPMLSVNELFTGEQPPS